MTLPSLFTCSDGSVVRSADDWRARRRPEILETLAREVYGTRPVERPPELCFEPVGEDTVTMDGRAVRKRVRIARGEVVQTRPDIGGIVFPAGHAREWPGPFPVGGGGASQDGREPRAVDADAFAVRRADGDVNGAAL